MFYHYSQNNSGGSFHENAKRGISRDVIIEENSPEMADSKAQIIGLYFEGCRGGLDCNCCGDRWFAQGSWSRSSDTPQVYDREVAPNQPLPKGESKTWMVGPGGYIHYLDGRVEPFW